MASWRFHHIQHQCCSQGWQWWMRQWYLIWFLLRSWKQTDDDIGVLSMGRLRLVATHMNRTLTKVRDRSAGSTNLKDNLGPKITANVATLLKRSAFNHVPIKIYIVKDTTNSMSKKQITNFCSLKKSRHYNFCSLKKRTLQTFVILKSRHYNFCSLKRQTLAGFCSLYPTFVVYVWPL